MTHSMLNISKSMDTLSLAVSQNRSNAAKIESLILFNQDSESKSVTPKITDERMENTPKPICTCSKKNRKKAANNTSVEMIF